MSSTIKKLYLISLIFVSVTFSLCAENIYHTVRKGETLYSISKKYHVPVNKLKAVNRIDSSYTIKIGSKLLVPGNSENSFVPGTNREKGFYLIKKGDTFYNVAKKFNMKLNDLYAMNNMNSNDILSVGFKIKVFGANLTTTQENKTASNPAKNNTQQKKQVVILSKPEKIVPKITQKSTPVENSIKDNLTVFRDKSIKLPVSGLYKPMSGKLRGAEITVTDEDYFKALEDGTVIWKGPFREFKNVILIDSGNYVYLFGGMDDIYVNVGQKVRRGDRIGGVGRLGNSKIYFSAFKDRMALDYKDVIGIISQKNI